VIVGFICSEEAAVYDYIFSTNSFQLVMLAGFILNI
jgi:hypothetical protein